MTVGERECKLVSWPGEASAAPRIARKNHDFVDSSPQRSLRNRIRARICGVILSADGDTVDEGLVHVVDRAEPERGVLGSLSRGEGNAVANPGGTNPRLPFRRPVIPVGQ